MVDRAVPDGFSSSDEGGVLDAALDNVARERWVTPSGGTVSLGGGTWVTPSGGTVSLGGGTAMSRDSIFGSPVPFAVPGPITSTPGAGVLHGVTHRSSDKKVQLNVRADRELKLRLRVAAARADMKVGEYVEHLLEKCLDEIDADAARMAGAEVVNFHIEAIRTPAADETHVTLDLLRKVLNGKGHRVIVARVVDLSSRPRGC